jgi:hypothetical protein
VLGIVLVELPDTAVVTQLIFSAVVPTKDCKLVGQPVMYMVDIVDTVIRRQDERKILGPSAIGHQSLIIGWRPE